MNWKWLTENWKTTLSGLLVFLLSIPTFVQAMQAWAAHQPVDWRSVLISIVMAVGLIAAKDSTTHSTAAQVETSTVKDEIAKAQNPTPPAKL